MKYIIYSLFVLLSMMTVSCEKIFFEPNPENNPEALFDDLWNTFRTDYAPFEQRGVDWQSEYDRLRPLVTPETNDDELRAIIMELLSSLNDMHVKFTVPDKKLFTSNVYFNDKIDYDLFDYELVRDSYFTSEVSEYGGGGAFAAWIGQVGYVHFVWISDNFMSMNAILDKFSEAEGLIIDLRHNGGGDFTYAYTNLGRLTAEPRFTHRSKTKNGPGKDDYTEWYEWYIYPEGEYFDKPLVLLTDRYTGSAAERTTMALKTLPKLVHIGDTTNGGHSTMIAKELVNGWAYTVSPQIIEFCDGKSYEGIGMIPDIPVKNSRSEMSVGTDRTLEAALNILNK